MCPNQTRMSKGFISEGKHTSPEYHGFQDRQLKEPQDGNPSSRNYGTSFSEQYVKWFRLKQKRKMRRLSQDNSFANSKKVTSFIHMCTVSEKYARWLRLKQKGKQIRWLSLDNPKQIQNNNILYVTYASVCMHVYWWETKFSFRWMKEKQYNEQ